MKEFRDAIATALRRHGAQTPATGSAAWMERFGSDGMFDPDADAILAMPEMQELRQALQEVADYFAVEWSTPDEQLDWREALEEWKFPKVIVDWVLEATNE